MRKLLVIGLFLVATLFGDKHLIKMILELGQWRMVRSPNKISSYLHTI